MSLAGPDLQGVGSLALYDFYKSNYSHWSVCTNFWRKSSFLGEKRMP